MIVLVVAVLAGASFDGGPLGVLVTLVSACLLTVICAALSNAIALMARQQEALIGISQFLSLPMTFLSSAIMDPQLAPDWIRTAARYNPLDWAVVASRECLLGTPDWSAVWPRLGALTGPGAGDGVRRDPDVRRLPAVDLNVRAGPPRFWGCGILAPGSGRARTANHRRCHPDVSSDPPPP